MADDPTSASAAGGSTRRDELLTFLLLTVVIAPALAVAFVGSYGLCVWLYQAIAGPPGPPPG
jgi:nitrate reductase NapE